VPVVLLETVRGLGQKGQIVTVKRGYARHFLVPKALALFGTWENIDAYADPTLMEDPTLQARAAGDRTRLAFDWVDEIRLRLVRWARDDNASVLRDPVTVWDLLEELSANHELDLLPSNLELPEEGTITTVGMHEVPVRIAFRNPEAAAGRYTLSVKVVSQQSLSDELRKEEMARAVKESMRFQLPQRGGAMDSLEDLEEGEEEHDAE
jgi:ribosomal protein L9